MAKPNRYDYDDFGPVDLDSARPGARSNRSGPRSASESLQPTRVQGPPTKARIVRHPAMVAFSFLVTAIVIALLAAGGAAVYATMEFDNPGPLGESRSVLIARGATLDTVADQLIRTGAVANRWVFWAGVRLNHQENNIKAGEFMIGAHASMREIVDSLVSGKALLYAVTIPEGLTSKQIIDRIKANEVLEGDIADEVPPEGTLNPDTYKFVRGDTRQGIVDRMKRERDRVVAEVWSHRSGNLPITTPEQMVTLASIVEKETGNADERSRVAGVFVNRLNKKMRLESDPTAIYGIWGTQGKPAGWLPAAADMKNSSPYNTYTHDGLPPGPIANPGRASLEAAANPARTKELYFVADGTGGHAFADTYAEHQKNVARLRVLERGDTPEPPPPAKKR